MGGVVKEIKFMEDPNKIVVPKEYLESLLDKRDAFNLFRWWVMENDFTDAELGVAVREYFIIHKVV